MVEDEYLAELFERAAGEPPSATAALERVRPRVRRARRRRAVMRGSAALVVLVVLGGIASRTATQPSQHVRVGDSGTTVDIESTTTSVAPPTTTMPTLGPPQAPAAPAPTVRPAAGDASRDSSASTAATTVPVDAAPASSPAAKPTVPRSSAKPPVSTAPNGATGAAAAPSGQSVPQVTSFDAQGGTVEVQYTDSAMNLQSVVPSPGWSVADTKSDGASIEVTFQSDDGAATGIDVHLDDQGRPTVDTPVDPVDDVVNGLTGS